MFSLTTFIFSFLNAFTNQVEAILGVPGLLAWNIGASM